MNQKRVVRLVGVPMDLGQRRRGVDMGPYVVRYAELYARLSALGYAVHDIGNVRVAVPEMTQEAPRLHDQPSARHLPAIVESLREVYEVSRDAASRGEIGVFLGGDHSISVGTISGQARGDRLGVVWVDAHADYNTPDTSPSGNVHGMPLAALVGDGPPELVDFGHPGPKLDPALVALVGLRDVDVEERRRLQAGRLNIFTMRDIDERGMAAVAHSLIERLADADRIHVSLDLDSLDPDIAPGVGTPVPGGLTYREAHLLMEILCDTGRVTSLDLVEINPILDRGNDTARLAVELAASLLGQRIL